MVPPVPCKYVSTRRAGRRGTYHRCRDDHQSIPSNQTTPCLHIGETNVGGKANRRKEIHDNLIDAWLLNDLLVLDEHECEHNKTRDGIVIEQSFLLFEKPIIIHSICMSIIGCKLDRGGNCQIAFGRASRSNLGVWQRVPGLESVLINEGM